MRHRTEHGQKHEPVRRLLDEADIGSGEESDADRETQRQIEQRSESDQANPDQALDEARARQQMIEGNADVSGTLERLEKKRSLGKDDPDSLINDTDPVPPKGN
ncbi:hypothetical protein ACFQAT_23400 [Undibacterium arcticum]|uniref:Uncharacterized protein n=1 Tax=Undibacterium arcticum TaxID=1762892 RepID=A0ABV7F655_9BURK